MGSTVKRVIKRFLPDRIVMAWRRRSRTLRWGDFRRIHPMYPQFGVHRGRGIDRYYIEQFLESQQRDIRGRVLEVAEPLYTKKFGGVDVVHADVLHACEGNPNATIVGDLVSGRGIPRDAFDCLVFTQTFPFIYDVGAAVSTSHAALKTGGVLLATFAGISQISRYDMDKWGDYWRFTDASARRLFGGAFGDGNVTVATHGNVLAACAFLQGLAAADLTREELDHRDEDYQVIVTVRAVKSR